MMSEKKFYPQIVLLHIMACGMILLCHISQDMKYGFLGELFLSGLSLFFIISGFLAGERSDFSFGWIRKRFKRILGPYFLILLISLPVYFFFAPEEFRWDSSIYLLTCTQGIHYIYWPFDAYMAMAGYGHLWFITEILLCIIITPILNYIWKKYSPKQWSVYSVVLLLIFVFQPFLIFLGINLSYLISYFIGFCISKVKLKCDGRFLGITLLATVVISLTRVVLRFYIDGTIFYDRYVALLSQAVLGLLIFVMIFYLDDKSSIVSKMANNNVVKFLSELTYEFYLLHYFFINGPWPLTSFIHSRLFAYAFITVVSVIGAYCLSILRYIVQRG